MDSYSGNKKSKNIISLFCFTIGSESKRVTVILNCKENDKNYLNLIEKDHLCYRERM